MSQRILKDFYDLLVTVYKYSFRGITRPMWNLERKLYVYFRLQVIVGYQDFYFRDDWPVLRMKH